jgi:hypothetical protein
MLARNYDAGAGLFTRAGEQFGIGMTNTYLDLSSAQRIALERDFGST